MGRLANAWKALRGQPQRPPLGDRTHVAGTGRRTIGEAAQFDYRRAAGDLARNPVVGICVDWLVRGFLQPDWCVGYETTRDEWTPQKHHKLRKLLENLQPTPDPRRKLTTRTVYAGAIRDFKLYGNAFLYVVENAFGEPLALDHLAAERIIVMVGPEGVLGYQYSAPDGTMPVYPPESIVHVIDQPDPLVPCIGMGQIQLQIVCVAALNVGLITNAALLRNGTMGKLITPKISVEAIQKGEQVDEAGLKELTASIRKRARGEGVGGTMETTLPVELLDLGASPEQLMINEMLDRPEAMIVAAMGLNPMALDLPSSRDSRTYANKAEAQKEAWQNGVVPLRESFADAFTSQLAIRYDDTGKLRVWSDYDDVPAMRDDAEKRANVANLLFTGMLAPRNTALQAGGFPPIEGPEGDKWYGEPTEAQMAQMEAQAEQEAVDGEITAERDHEFEMEKMKTEAELYAGGDA